MSVVVFACHDSRHRSAAHAHKVTHINTLYAQILELYKHTHTCIPANTHCQSHKDTNDGFFTVMSCMIQTLCVYVSKHHDLLKDGAFTTVNDAFLLYLTKLKVKQRYSRSILRGSLLQDV